MVRLKSNGHSFLYLKKTKEKGPGARAGQLNFRLNKCGGEYHIEQQRRAVLPGARRQTDYSKEIQTVRVRSLEGYLEGRSHGKF